MRRPKQYAVFRRRQRERLNVREGSGLLPEHQAVHCRAGAMLCATCRLARCMPRFTDNRPSTLGQGTSSSTPLSNLRMIEQNWTVASATSVSDGSAFNYFSAVCWFFGKGAQADRCGGTGAQHTPARLQRTFGTPCGYCGPASTRSSASRRTRARRTYCTPAPHVPL